ncbi:MAG: indolepyruvate oxidoreductase [Lentisphaerae bacterium RIFOXYB12_FULL_65_16]|nr:MAG: indolepyruvate oxidoreductase [Lentisphaerae bacterium RIFOXYA12_64_32]OGV86083.1 MAG: indolepyruvate oxidoreductase [Lentisphaerae bacterium RIFOXYB12_FULL_65_16]
MKNDIVLAGVGGQGILTIAAIVGRAAVGRGLNVKQSEVHGMAQRGGSVSSHLRLSSDTIWSDLIPLGGADVLLSVEPLEALRHMAQLAPNGVLLATDVPITNIGDYPDLEAIKAEIRRYPRQVLINADQMAKDAGSIRAMNMVMLGALSCFLDLPVDTLTGTIQDVFARKGDKVVEVNLKAFAAGRAAGQTVER